MIRALLTLTLAGLFMPGLALSAKFSNRFVEFELPSSWACNLEGAEWVCQSSEEQKKRDAIIILAAKLKGDQDNLDDYLAYLKKPKSFTSVRGKPVKSEVKWAKTEKINDHVWVDSLHLESEIPGFYTRYLATVKEDIGVLVTYSINKNKYQNYLNDFDILVKTLKVFRKGVGINAQVQGEGGGTAPDISGSKTALQTSIFQQIETPDITQGGAKQKSNANDALTFYILIGVLVIGFIIWRRKRNQG